MGMAASQARFLGLTARRNNIEFEGQQINQQRTCLSNQSANYYNDLLGMTVPTPPSVDEFTKTVYTFTDGALTNTVTALIAKANGEYVLSYLQAFDDEFTPVFDSTAIVTKVGDDEPYAYQIGNNLLRTITNFNPNSTEEETEAAVAALRASDPENEYIDTLSDSQAAKLLQEESNYLALLNEKYGDQNWLIRYRQNTTTGAWEPVFYKQNEIALATYDDNGNSQSNIKAYKMGSEQKTTEVKNVQGCVIEKDSTGRFMNITIPDGNGNSTTYSLVTQTVTDQDAYEDAMNQYEYDKYQYDQTIQEITSKIEIVQAQDKNLELRLKQLDTEHNAVQTEMETVSKVIQKNTEDSFKTFNA